VGVLHLLACRQVANLGGDPKGLRDDLRQPVYGVWCVCTDVEHLVVGLRLKHAMCNVRRHIVDIAKSASLRAIAKDGHGLALHDLIHKDADHVAIPIADVLVLAIDIMGAKND